MAKPTTTTPSVKYAPKPGNTPVPVITNTPLPAPPKVPKG